MRMAGTKRPWIRGSRLGLLLLLAARGGGVRSAEFQSAPAPPVPPDVYVNDSFEAADAIANARRLAEAGQWAKAAELLQQTADTHGDKLIRVGPGLFVGVRAHIVGLIAEWPPDGLNAYRTLFERELQTALGELSAVRDMDLALRLYERYFCTAGAADLTDVIGQLALESGDLSLAWTTYQRAAAHHPDRAQHASRWTAMLAIIRVLRRTSAPDSRHRAETLRPEEFDPDVRIRWRGEPRAVGEIVEEIRQTFTSSSSGRRAAKDEWPIFGGNASRSALATSRVDDLGLLWRFEWQEGVIEQTEDEGLDAIMSVPYPGGGVSAQPVVAGDFVVVQRFRDVLALQGNTGAVAWRFRADAGTAVDIDELEERPAGWDSATIHNGRVYAAIPGDVAPHYGYESARSAAELVCLDAANGRAIWRSDSEAHGDAYAEFHFDSSPIVADGQVFVVGRRRRSFGFEDCYLYGLDAADGTIRFKVHVGSAVTGTFGARQPTISIPAMEGDTVYVCSNLGTVAAVSAHTGGVRWLRAYDRIKPDDARGAGWAGQRRAAGQFNPVIVEGGRVFVLPLDAERLLLLDRTDGEILDELRLDELNNLRSLLGVHDETLCGVGDGVLCYDLSTASLRWTTSAGRDPAGASGMSQSDHVPVGRGVWADERLYVPTRAALLTIDVADGSLTRVPWAADGEPGNVLALPDRLIVAGSRTVSAYSRKEEVWSALRERMAAAPTDPAAALDLAEVALGSGETDDALQALEEAVTRAGGFAVALEPSLQSRLFADALSFSARLSRRGELEATELAVLFGYASHCPSDAAEHVRYRLHFAPLFGNAGQPDRALQLYQQILRDRSLRDVAMDAWQGADSTGRADRAERRSEPGAGLRAEHVALGRRPPAGAYAAEMIAALIADHGRDLYAPFEAEASAALEQAVRGRDEEGLERIVATFPNAQAAFRAMLAHAALLLETGRSEEAALRYTAALHRYPDMADGPDLMRRIADAYEQAKKPRHAYRWLVKAAREYPSALVEVDGRTETMRAYRDRLRHVRAEVEPHRPQISLPLGERMTTPLGEGAELLPPRFSDFPECDWSRYFVRTPGGIQAFDAFSGRALWVKPVPMPDGAELLLATPEQSIVATLYELFALDATTGERRWTLPDSTDGDKQTAPPDDWEQRRALRAHGFFDGRLVSAYDDGTLVAIQVATGRVLWSWGAGPAPAGPLVVSDYGVVYHHQHDGSAVLNLLDPADGHLKQQIETQETGSVGGVFVSLENQVILVTSQAVSVYDGGSGQLSWRTALDGRVQRASVILDVDALYLSDDGRRLLKISLQDGAVRWQTERLIAQGEGSVTAELLDDTVILSSTASIAGVDAVTGMILWVGTTPARPQFVVRLLADQYLMALHVPDPMREEEAVAYFYDYRNASGVIPRSGGALKLGRLDDLRHIFLTDAGLLIQTGTELQAWRGTAAGE